MLKNQKLFILFVAAFLLSLTAFIPNGFALKSDRNQPADISSDEVDIDFNTGRRTFIGNVRFVQGTLRVKGDRIDAKFKDGKLVEAIAYGKPAAFKQRPDGKKNDVEGRGLTIVLNQKSNLLTLKKRASLKQGADVAKGTVIIYNMGNDTLQVKGNATGSTGKKKANTPKPKTQTDSFFNEKTPNAPLKGASTDNNATAPTQTAPSTSTIRSSDDLPDELILPGQSSASETDETPSGRSRLILKPRSK